MIGWLCVSCPVFLVVSCPYGVPGALRIIPRVTVSHGAQCLSYTRSSVLVLVDKVLGRWGYLWLWLFPKTFFFPQISKHMPCAVLVYFWSTSHISGSFPWSLFSDSEEKSLYIVSEKGTIRMLRWGPDSLAEVVKYPLRVEPQECKYRNGNLQVLAQHLWRAHSLPCLKPSSDNSIHQEFILQVIKASALCNLPHWW